MANIVSGESRYVCMYVCNMLKGISLPFNYMSVTYTIEIPTNPEKYYLQY